MAIEVQYQSNEDGVTVRVAEDRPAPPSSVQQVRQAVKGFGKGAQAEDDGLTFVHGVHHGEIKLDDILPPWEG